MSVYFCALYCTKNKFTMPIRRLGAGKPIIKRAGGETPPPNDSLTVSTPPPPPPQQQPTNSASGPFFPTTGGGHTIVTTRPRRTHGGTVTRESLTVTNRIDLDRYGPEYVEDGTQLGRKPAKSPYMLIRESSFYCPYGHTKSVHDRNGGVCPGPDRWFVGGWPCCCLLLGLLICLLYFLLRQSQLAERRRQLAEQGMYEQIRMFPTDPYEYNMRQRLWHQMTYRRRHNFFAVGLFSVAVIFLLVVMIWHRYRKVAIHKRKTVGFWVFTAIAVVMAIAYPVYLVKIRSPVSEVVHQVRVNPFFRFSLLMTLILLLAILFYAYKRYEKHQHKLHHHHHPGVRAIAAARRRAMLKGQQGALPAAAIVAVDVQEQEQQGSAPPTAAVAVESGKKQPAANAAPAPAPAGKK